MNRFVCYCWTVTVYCYYNQTNQIKSNQTDLWVCTVVRRIISVLNTARYPSKRIYTYCCRYLHCFCCIIIIIIIIIIIFIVVAVVVFVFLFLIVMLLFLYLFGFKLNIEEIDSVRRIVCVLNMTGRPSKRIHT